LDAIGSSLPRQIWSPLLTALLVVTSGVCAAGLGETLRPNILLAIADDASWAHFGAYGDPVVRTPTVDRLAREGVRFTHAFCSSPSCTPSRGALLTGQAFWRLEAGANLWSVLPNRFPVYPDLLETAGYHVGLQGKGWGPGDFKGGGWTRNPAGPPYRDFGTFLRSVPAGKPFVFWFGSSDPHRTYDPGSGARSGLEPEAVRVPPFLPDTEAVRRDLLDYYFEIERFDRDLGAIIQQLESAGQLDNTVVVVTSDNGFPFPRGKANLYDFGARMPLVVRWPARIKAGQVIEDFVSLTDLAPTFLEVAGLKAPAEMTGRSLLPLFATGQSGWLEPTRGHVVYGRERHANVRAGILGYPSRALRTRDFLYIRNFAPNRWPAGDPPVFGDCDQAYDIDGSPSKAAILRHQGEPSVQPLFERAFAQRPAEELYELASDPFQLSNLAADPRHAATRARLRTELERALTAAQDPRVTGTGDQFDRYRYYTPPPATKKRP